MELPRHQARLSEHKLVYRARGEVLTILPAGHRASMSAARLRAQKPWFMGQP